MGIVTLTGFCFQTPPVSFHGAVAFSPLLATADEVIE
jgi:hypothetical protein